MPKLLVMTERHLVLTKQHRHSVNTSFTTFMNLSKFPPVVEINYYETSLTA